MNIFKSIICIGNLSLSLLSIGCSSSAGGVGALPSADVSSYDYSLVSTSSSTSLEAVTGLEFSKNLQKQFNAVAPGAVGGYSVAGCHVNQMRENVFQPSVQIEAMKCRIKGMIAAGIFKEPTEIAQIYKLAITEEGRDPKTIHFKMSKSTDGTYKLLVCQAQFGSDTPTLNEEMSFGKDADGKESFTIHHKHAHEEPTFETHIGGTYKSQMIMKGTADGNDGDVSVTGQFVSKFTPTGGGAEEAADAGQITFSRDSKTKTNSIKATFQNKRNGGDQTGKVYAKWNDKLGAAKFDNTGHGPGFPCPNAPTTFCCFDPAHPETPTAADGDGLCTIAHSGNQTYSITTTIAEAITSQEWLVVATGDVSWYDEVIAASFPDVEAVTFAFDDNWDCGNGDAALITVASADMEKAKEGLQACEDIAKKAFHKDNFISCERDVIDKQI